MTSTMTRPPRSQRIAATIQPLLLRMQSSLLSLSAGYLLGRLVNATSDPHIIGLSNAFRSLFILKQSANILTYASILLFVAIPLLDFFVRYQKRKGRPETLLFHLAHGRIDAIAASFGREALTWGSDVTLQLAPDLQKGWPVEDVEIIYDGTAFTLPSDMVDDYEKFLGLNSERFKQDGTKYMLVRNPNACSDAPRLSLEIQETQFSIIRYYQECVATIKSRRDVFLEETIKRGKISFPSSLCMHAVVTTNDNRVLITKRSHKVDYSPGKWSVSVEEQLSPHDLPNVSGVVKRWAQRLLLEELAVQPMDYNLKNLRLLSIFLEVETMNCSLAAVLPINLSSMQLNETLEAMPRTDYEFTEWRFLSYEELAEELRNVTLPHHPSSGYRILLALANRFGSARVADKLFPDGMSA